MSQFRVALSADFLTPDGAPAFPMFDLGPLDGDPQIDWAFVRPEDGRMTAASLEDFDALILLGANFDAESIPADGRLALVARFGVGYDSVDVAACARAGIAVTITPDGVRRPVAVSILTFVLALAGKLFVKDGLAREGASGFARRSDHMGVGLIGRTLGSIGIGNIGAEMFRMFAPLDMRFIAHDPFVAEADAAALGVTLVDLDRVFRDSDFLAVNLPLTPETEKLVDAKRLAMMKPSAYLINTSRGPIVDPAALVAALRDGTIAGAGIDVFDPEPPSPDDPLLGLDNVIVTPHALCWTDQCFAGIGASTVAAAMTVKRGAVPDHMVERSVAENATFRARLECHRKAFG
ncbi:MAG: NAD(P)-dependent oxidoreductase [Alphaproteobacteria bacterium]